MTSQDMTRILFRGALFALVVVVAVLLALVSELELVDKQSLNLLCCEDTRCDFVISGDKKKGAATTEAVDTDANDEVKCLANIVLTLECCV